MTSKRVQQIVKSLDAKVQKLLKPDRFYVALYDEVRSELSFLLVNGKKNVVWESRSYIPAQFPDQVIEKQSQILFEKDAAIQMEAEGANCWSDEQKPASWLGVPMIFEERVLGVLVVESQMPQAFGERGLRVLNTMAKQTASAIENARLYERLNRRIKDLDAVNEIGQELTSGIQLEESEILALIHKQANKLIHADNMYIALYDEAQDEIRFPLIYVGGEKIEVAARKLDRNQMGKTEYIILERDSLFHATRAESKAWYDQPGHVDHIKNPLASWIGVPMVVRDKVIGAIAAYHKDQDYVYDDHDLLILKSMASQAAIAVDNARIISELEQAQKRVANTEAELVRGDIARDFVHRMNNLAGTIPIWVDLIKTELKQEKIQIPEIDQYLEKIWLDARGLLEGAERLRHPLEEQTIDIDSILRSMSRRVKTEYRGNINITCEPPLGLFHVSSVPTTLINAIWNIVNNGVEAISNKDDGYIEMEANNLSDSSGNKWVQIKINDNGDGLAEENLKNVFELSFTTKGGGRGYGLWRSKVIIENTGGTISVESDQLNGTTFTILLPALGDEHE